MHDRRHRQSHLGRRRRRVRGTPAPARAGLRLDVRRCRHRRRLAVGPVCLCRDKWFDISRDLGKLTRLSPRRGKLVTVLLLAIVANAAAQTKSSYAGVYTSNFTAPGRTWASFGAPNTPCGATVGGAAAGCDVRGVFNGNTSCVPSVFGLAFSVD